MRRIRLNGMLGTLHIHGNHLVQITVAAAVLESLKGAPATNNVVQLFGMFGRLPISDNVIEGDNNLIVDQHLAMTANDFKLTGRALGSPNVTAQLPIIAGVVIADSSIYTGNHSRAQNVILWDVSRVSTQAANLEITISRREGS